MNCYGCLKPVRTTGYCPKCSQEMFDGRKVKPLSFDKKEFYVKREELHKSMSISGVQDKISLRFGETSGELEPTGEDGQYILKPVPSAGTLKNLSDIVPNEHVSMQISKQVFGINTASCALIEFKGGELAYITRRFDYTSDYRAKLDQEDFASALQYTEERQGDGYKYAGSYEECAHAIQSYVPASAPALEDFFKRIVLNYLVGNGDAHLKNFSCYFPEGRSDRALTPSYDLMNTRYHVGDDDLALDLFANGVESASYGAMGYETLEDFEMFAKLIGIPGKRVVKLFDAFTQSTDKAFDLLDRSYLSAQGRDAYKQMYTERLEKRLKYSPAGIFASSLLSFP